MASTESKTRRHFAIVPGAGRSIRMGRPKLLLPWNCDDRRIRTVIDSVLSAWTESHVDEVVVVIRSDDEELQQACEHWPIKLLTADTPPVDMKGSVQLGLELIANEFSPTDEDSVFVAPADIPRLTSELLGRIIAESPQQEVTSIRVPSFRGKRGHPALLPWSIAKKVKDLAADEGVNVLLEREEVIELPMPVFLSFSDINTPEAYRRELERGDP